jgi:hypothetical protein
MSTVESLPHTGEPEPSAEALEAVVVAEPESQVRLAAPAKLPVAAHVPQPVSLPPAAVQTRARKELLVPLREAAGQLVPQLQYQIARLGIAGQAGLAACVAAVVLSIAALVPAYRAVQGLHEDLVRAQHAPNPATIVGSVPQLVASLPTRAEIPAVIGQIYAQAQSAGVSVDKGRYAYVPAKAGAIARYEVELPVTAPYPAIRTFINGTLTAVPAASVEKLRLERKAVGEQAVKGDIAFVVFVRGEAQP